LLDGVHVHVEFVQVRQVLVGVPLDERPVREGQVDQQRLDLDDVLP